jgi:hypothetical protein
VNLENERIQRASESILEDESLTAGLDDAAARLLVDWGLDCVHTILEGESQAEERIELRLHAVRDLMRLVARWALNHARMTPSLRYELSSALREQAALIYGVVDLPSHRLEKDLAPGSPSQPAAQQQALINELRRLIEPRRPAQPRRRP